MEEFLYEVNVIIEAYVMEFGETSRSQKSLAKVADRNSSRMFVAHRRLNKLADRYGRIPEANRAEYNNLSKKAKTYETNAKRAEWRMDAYRMA